MMNRLKISILRNAYINVLIFDIISKIIVSLTTVILIRCLTISQYSEFTMFTTLSGYIAGILGSGLSVAVTRHCVEYYSRFNKTINGLYWILDAFFYCLFFISIFICISAKKLNSIFFLSIMYGFLLCIDKLNVSYYQSKEHYTLAGIISNVKNISFFILITIYLLSNNYSELILIYLFFIIITLLSDVFISFNIIVKCKNLDIKENVHHIKKIFSNSIYIIIYMTFLNAFNYMDIFFIRMLCRAEAVAEYGVAFKYYNLLLSLLPTIQIVKNIQSAKADIIDNSYKRKNEVKRWIKTSTPIAIILFIIGIPATYILFPILNGVRYNNAIILFIILMFGAMISYVTSPNVNFMLSTKKGGKICLFAALAFIFNIIGNYMLVSHIGAIGASLTTVAANFLFNGLCTISVLKE